MNSVALTANILVQVLIKVDDRVLQGAFATRSLTLAACLVLMDPGSSANFVIS